MVGLEIRMLKILREWNEVEVILRKDLKEYETLTIKLPYAKAGEIISVPLWVAKVLINERVASIDIEKLNEWINRVYWREKVQIKGSYNISRLPPEFYTKVSLISFLIEKLQEEENYPALEILRRGMDRLREVINKRKNAIPVLSEIEETSITERLTYEEKVLLRIFKEIINSWKSYTGV